MCTEHFECDACHRKFKSARSLTSHYRFCKVGTHAPKSKTSKYKIQDNLYRCECGREFQKFQSLNAHFCYCMIHKHACNKPECIAESKIRKGADSNFSKQIAGQDKIDQMHQKSRETRRKNIVSGKTSNSWIGRKHTDETKQKQRIGMCNWLNSLPIDKRRANYNPASIVILDNIAKAHGWNIQHALNGGEFYTGIGYFVDGYDKEKNIVLEYDEPKHYIDAEHNILTEKDIIRQTKIIEHLKCEFWRYNEATQCLWRVL